MILPFPASRASDEFARLVEGETPLTTDFPDELLSTVAVLRAATPPAPRPDFVLDLRERLMTAADTELLPVDDRPPLTAPRRARQRRWGERQVGVAAAAVVLVGSTAGLAAAAQSSLPGDSLYPLKRGIENVQVQLHNGDTSRGTALLDRAAVRVDEIQDVLGARSEAAATDTVTENLSSFTADADQGADLLFEQYQRADDTASVAAVSDFAHQQMDRLLQLSSLAPTGAESAFLEAAQTLIDLDRQARTLCSSCGGDEPLTMPDSLTPALASAGVGGLLSDPVLDVQRAEALARAAEKTADQAKAAATSSGSSAPETTTKAPALPTVPLPGSTQAPRPVRDAVKGVTDGVTTVTSQVGSGLGDLTGGLTDGLTETLNQTTEGLTGGLNNLLGGSRD